MFADFQSFFHRWIQREIYNKTFVFFTTTPYIFYDTTLWNVKSEK